MTISEKDKSLALESALFHFSNQQPFMGGLIQELTMRYRSDIQTAAITYNQKTAGFEIYFNPTFFCGLTSDQRVAVLYHEILHFTQKHLFRLPFIDASEEDRRLYNMGGDMAINQYIKHLPDGGIDVKDWKHVQHGVEVPFPTYRSMEEYYELLKNNKEANKEQFEKYRPFDDHDWEKLDEETKKKMLDEAKKVIKRTMEKTSYSHNTIPESIKDLLEEIETLAAGLDYKSILKAAIKRTVSASDRENTWKRPNKRYGVVSPGSKIGNLPKLGLYVDTSGSISAKELNSFLQIISNFLAAGSRECTLSLWHTEVYHKQKYKLRSVLDPEVISSGGTDLECALQAIKKDNPNLAIILTDGFYDAVSITIPSEVIFIISSGGNKDHGMKHLGKTILLDGIT